MPHPLKSQCLAECRIRQLPSAKCGESFLELTQELTEAERSTITDITLEGALTVEMLSALCLYPHLEMLSLRNAVTELTETICRELADKCQIEHLYLDRSKLGASRFAYLGVFNLIGFSARDTNFNDSDCSVLESFRALNSLYLNNTQVTLFGLRNLRHCRELIYVDVSGTPNMPSNEEALQHINDLIREESQPQAMNRNRIMSPQTVSEDNSSVARKNRHCIVL